MPTHVALLRGVNVSGQNTMRMETLKTALTADGFQDVQTFIQSGNVIFNSEETQQEVLAFKIKRVVFSTFGHDIGVMMRYKSDLEQIVKNNPFDTESNVYVALLDKEPQQDDFQKLVKVLSGGDLAILSGRTLYVKYGVNAGKSKLSNKLIETKLKVNSTMRNWNTTVKVLELLS